MYEIFAQFKCTFYICVFNDSKQPYSNYKGIKKINMKLEKKLIKEKSKQYNVSKKATQTAMKVAMGIISSKTQRLIFTIIVIFVILLAMVGMINTFNFIIN